LYELLAEVWRGDLVESVHHGSAVAVDPSGRVLRAYGDVDLPMYPRSANKPLQALAMVRAGLELEPRLLALAGASHAGESFHVEGARRILAGAGLTVAHLRCTPDYPLDDLVRREHLAAGLGREPVYSNCSGKHAAMLATCVHNDWPTGSSPAGPSPAGSSPAESYLDPGHPLQTAIRDTIAELTGEAASHVSVDGCGAPLFGSTLTGLARAFAALDGTPVAEAMREHPKWVDGSGRSNTVLMRAIPGAIAKGGAEGVLALAVPGGPSVAVKIADGAKRATAVVLVALLEQLGVDVGGVAELATFPVYGGAERVGDVRPAAILRPAGVAPGDNHRH
jgi:L-asparaginase II